MRLILRTPELRRLLENEILTIEIPENIESFFNAYCKKRKKVDDKDIEPLEFFYAGYILSNPVFREKFMKEFKPIRGRKKCPLCDIFISPGFLIECYLVRNPFLIS